MSCCGFGKVVSDKLRVGDFGRPFVAEFKQVPSDFDACSDSTCDLVAIDISGFTELKMTFIKPDGTEVEKTDALPAVTLVTDGTDGQFQYVLESSLLDVAGSWRFKSQVTLASARHSGDDVCFEVLT